MTSHKPPVCTKRPTVGIARRGAGFTLTELIITVTIAGLLAAMAAPAIGTLVSNQRISGQANDLLADLNLARSEGIRRGAAVVICKTANPSATSPTCNTTDANEWTSGRLIFADADGDNQLDAGEEVLRVRQALEGTTNRLLGDGAATGSANRIVYQANGVAGSAAGTVFGGEVQLRVCDARGGAQALAIAIQPTGRARVTAKGVDMGGAAINC